MIHQVISFPENEQRLYRIIDLQLSVLKEAANSQNIDDNSIRKAVTSISPSSDFENSQIDEIVKWFTRKPKLMNALLAFAAHTQKEKQDFVQGIEHDIELIKNPQPEHLQVVVDKTSPDWQKAAADFLLQFYALLGQEGGFSAYLFHPSVSQTEFNRWDFIDNFTAANPNLQLCAVCDSTLYRTTIGDKPYTSIEHFFPKSRYPHLAIHPRNLIPICSHCNSGAAGAIDPLDTKGRGISGLLLPYQAGSGLSEQTYVYVSPNSDRSKHPLQLKMLPSASTPNVQELINNFERIYKVEERWNKDLEWIDQHVFRRITQFLMSDVQAGNDLSNVALLSDRLRLLMAIISKEHLGQDPFGYATIWILKYYIDELTASQKPDSIPIYSALTDWAETQQTRWEEYRERAEALIKRSLADTSNTTS